MEDSVDGVQQNSRSSSFNADDKNDDDGDIMLVGNKDRFAIEFELDEFFDNSFVAFGTYRIYVNGFCYGEKSPGPSWFGGVVYGFKELIEEKRNYENFFSEYSDMETIKTYWHFFWYNPFPTPKKMLEEDNKDFLGIKGKEKNFWKLRLVKREQTIQE